MTAHSFAAVVLLPDSLAVFLMPLVVRLANQDGRRVTYAAVLDAPFGGRGGVDALAKARLR